MQRLLLSLALVLACAAPAPAQEPAARSMEISNRRVQQFLPEMQQQIMQRMTQGPDATKKP